MTSSPRNTISPCTLHGSRLLDPGALLVQVDLGAAPTVRRVDLHVTGDAAQVARALLDGARGRRLAVSRWHRCVPRSPRRPPTCSR